MKDCVSGYALQLHARKDEKEAEEMELEEKDFKQELGITEGKCASP